MNKGTQEKRYYFAITNHCNRSCGPCCCYSRPDRGTFLPLERFAEILPKEGFFEIQLEGGEPTLHPRWQEMIGLAAETGRCRKITIGTNGATLPFSTKDGKLNGHVSIRRIESLFSRLPTPLVLKVSINHYLYEADPTLFDKAVLLHSVFQKLKNDRDYQLIFNVRLRKQADGTSTDHWITERMEQIGLRQSANIFYFQRYGFASDALHLEIPYIVENTVDFYLIDPTGRNWGKDLIARSEAMKEMP